MASQMLLRRGLSCESERERLCDRRDEDKPAVCACAFLLRAKRHLRDSFEKELFGAVKASGQWLGVKVKLAGSQAEL